MVSITGTQHRHVQAGATKQTSGGDDAQPHGKSESSVGHVAKSLVAARTDEYTGPSAQGKAAAYIAKLSLDDRAKLLEELRSPVTDDTATPPSDGTTIPPTDGITAPPTDETTTPPTEGTTTPSILTPMDAPADDAAVAILDEIIAAADENNQPV
jgi:hypothetical protein